MGLPKNNFLRLQNREYSFNLDRKKKWSKVKTYLFFKYANQNVSFPFYGCLSLSRNPNFM